MEVGKFLSSGAVATALVKLIMVILLKFGDTGLFYHFFFNDLHEHDKSQLKCCSFLGAKILIADSASLKKKSLIDKLTV